MTDTYYPHLREVLDPRFSGLSDSELDSVFESAFGEGITAAEYEEFFGGLGRALGGLAQRAGPVLGSSAQGAISGAAAGSALGPWGALGGALIGGVGSALAQHGRGPARDVGRVIGTFTGAGAMPAPPLPVGPAAPGQPVTAAAPVRGAPIPVAAPGSPAPAAPPPPATSAISWLGQLLASPAAAQAIAALMQGRGGTVPVGATATPVQASEVVGLMGALAREAEAEAMQWDVEQGVPAYLIGAEGELESDPYDVDLRAVRLLELFASEAEWDEELDAEDLYELDESELGFGEDLELYDSELLDPAGTWSP
jgi:hypothetical protein